jgi:hypothetical protein
MQGITVGLYPILNDCSYLGHDYALLEPSSIVLTTVTCETAGDVDFLLFDCVFDYSVVVDNLRPFLDKIIIPTKFLDRIANRTAAILINIVWESFLHEKTINSIHQWINDCGLQSTSVFYLTSAVNAKEVYSKVCELTHVNPKLTIIRHNKFQLWNGPGFGEDKLWPDVMLSKKFLCLNKRSRIHRLMILTLICQDTEISSNCFLSNLDIENQVATTGILHNVFDNLRFKASFDDIISGCQFRELDYTRLTRNSNGDLINDIYPAVGSTIEPFFDQSLFSIVNETTQRNDESEFNGVPHIFCTDKIFKVFSFYHIPIINGGHGLVKYLREEGFDMFDDIVDHSYDSIIDENERLFAVFDEIVRINSMYTLSRCNDLKQNMQARLINNREFLHYRKGKSLNLLVTDLSYAINNATNLRLS